MSESDSRRILGRFEVRTGAAGLSVITTMLAGAVSAVGWVEFATLPSSRVPFYAFVSTGVVFSLIALFAFAGLPLSLAGKASTLKRYAREISYLPLAPITSTILLIIFLFSDGDHGFLGPCLDGLRVDDLKTTDLRPTRDTDSCFMRLATMKAIFIPLLTVTILALVYYAYIVRQYSRQREDDLLASAKKSQEEFVAFPRADDHVFNPSAQNSQRGQFKLSQDQNDLRSDIGFEQ